MGAGSHLQELIHANFYNFESLTGLGFSSFPASDCLFIESPSSWCIDFPASDLLVHLGQPPSAYSSPSSQVTMDDDTSTGYLNSPMKLQESVFLGNSNTQQPEPWHEAKKGCCAPSSTDIHQSCLQKSVQRQTKITAAKRKFQEMKKIGHDNKRKLRNKTNSSPPLSDDNKIGKEKMGDRIATLQRLVSPFGKSDTASVLSECIEYIRFLHEQVSVLSTSYGRKNGAEAQYFQDFDDCFYDPCGLIPDSETGLRSRGLGIVPVSIAITLTHDLALGDGNKDSESNNTQT